MNGSWIDTALWIWFALTALSTAYIAWDLFTRTPEMKVMKWGWVLVALYTGPVAFVIYWFSCRESFPGAHEKFVAPQWKQTIGSLIHCMAGDATGIIVAAVITAALGLPMGVDAVLEYAAGFSFGLFIFQALFMKDIMGVSYWQAVKSTVIPEWLSMNVVMAGMIPTMIILMTWDMGAMEPTSPRFWGIMSLATLVGGTLAFPINWWLVERGLKHGMGTERVLGKGGSKVPQKLQEADGIGKERSMKHDMSSMKPDDMKMDGMKMDDSPTAGGAKADGSDMAAISKNETPKFSTASLFLVSLLSMAVLAGGFALAARYGDFSMSAKDAQQMGAMAMSTDKTMSEGKAKVPFEQQFLDSMVPHHQSALEMAKIVAPKAQYPEVRALASRIIKDQQREIAAMKQMRRTLYGSAEAAPMSGMSGDSMPGMEDGAMNSSTVSMPGVLMGLPIQGEMDMNKLRSLSGPELDREFLQMMVPHHANAVVMAQEVLGQSKQPELRRLAQNIIGAQAKEIGEMEAIAKRRFGSLYAN